MNQNKQSIDSLLNNRLTSDELEHFLSVIKHDSNMQTLVNKESGFEALLLSQQWSEHSVPTSRIIDDILHDESTQEEHTTTSATDSDSICWEAILTKSFKTSQENKLSFLIPFFSLFLYKNRILMVLLVIIGMFFIFIPYYSEQGISKKSIAANQDSTQINTHSHSTETSVISTIIEKDTFCLVKDSIPQEPIHEYYSKNRIQLKLHEPQNRKSVVYISENTGILSENNSEMTILEHTDSTVAIHLKKGTALFTVEKKRYKRFAVITPVAEIVVTGTVFRVAAQEKSITVSVLEGSVQVTTIHGTQDIITVSEEKSVTLFSDSLVQSLINNSLTLQSHQKLLKGYLRYLNTAQLQHFPVEPLFSALSNRENIVIDSLAKTNNALTSAQMMHYRLARNYETRSAFYNALDEYQSIISQNQNSATAELSLIRSILISCTINNEQKQKSYINSYCTLYPNSSITAEVKALQIRLYLDQNDSIDASDAMKSYIKEYPSLPYTEHIAFQYAQLLRNQKQDYTQAMDYYEFVVTSFPQSVYREDATYWAGWCLVQEKLQKKENRFFKEYIHDYPDGIWRGAIMDH